MNSYAYSPAGRSTRAASTSPAGLHRRVGHPGALRVSYTEHERREVPIPLFLLDELTQHVAGKQPNDLVFTGPRSGGVLRGPVFCEAAFDTAAASIGNRDFTRTNCAAPAAWPWPPELT